MNQTKPTRIRDGDKWRWQWQGWTSSAHEYLEERSWTPWVIGGELCFSARNGNKWTVVWGDRCAREYDDAYDTTDCNGVPLYVAREGQNWLLVLGSRESQRFPQQVSYKIVDGKPMIRLFDQPESELIEPLWQPPPTDNQ